MALGGHRLVVRHNNQPIVGGSNMVDDGEDALGGVYGGGIFCILGRQIEWSMTRRWTSPPPTMSMPLATTPKMKQSTHSRRQ